MQTFRNITLPAPTERGLRFMAALATYMQAQFFEKLSTRFEIGNKVSPGTLRIKLTLAGAAANVAAHALFLTNISQSPEFRGDVSISGHSSASSAHWLILV